MLFGFGALRAVQVGALHADLAQEMLILLKGC